MSAPFSIGTVGHFGLAVSDPRKSADWYVKMLGMHVEFEYEDGIAIGSDGVTIALHRGAPHPATIGHVSFHLKDVRALEAALGHLRACGADLEDPGDEIGPEGPDSPHVGLWVHDPDGYRLELNVQNGARDFGF